MENNDSFVTLAKETVYKNKWSSITRTLVKRKGLEKEIFTTNFGRRSALILFCENKVLLTKQYRLLIDDFSWEIPGGKADDSETFEEAAIRECLEETSYNCKSLSLLISFEPGLETLHNPTQIFLSKDFEKSKEDMNNETVESKWFEVDQIKELYGQGFFLDSLTIIGLQALLLQRLK